MSRFASVMELRDKILLGAFDLYMKYGIKSVSMDDIASKLGVSKKTIYQLIENKKDLVKTVILRYMEKDEVEINAIAKNADNAIDEMVSITRHILFFLRNMKPSLIFDLQKYHPESWELIGKQHFTFIHVIIQANIERGIKEKLYRSEVNADIITRFFTKVSECVVDENIFPLKEFRHTDLFVQHVNYHMRGIVNEEGRILLNKLELK